MDALLALGCPRRIILTGTPMQNNMDEFYGEPWPLAPPPWHPRATSFPALVQRPMPPAHARLHLANYMP